MKNLIIEIPMRGEKITKRNREQTEQLCYYYGYEYLTSKTPTKVKDLCDRLNVVPEAIAKFEGSNEGGPFVLVVTLCNGSFSHNQVYGMLEKKNLEWVSMKALCDECGYYGPSGWFNKEQELIGEAENPHDLTAAMDALLALEKKNNA